MKKSEMNDVKKKLISEQTDIHARIAELKEDDPFSDPEYANDNAAVDNDVREQEAHQRIEAEIETLQDRLEDIDGALERIAKGRYGRCKRCNKEIPSKRLELVPETSYCVVCESEIKS